MASVQFRIDPALVKIIDDIQRDFYNRGEPITKIEASWVLAKVYMGFDKGNLITYDSRKRKRKNAIAMMV